MNQQQFFENSQDAISQLEEELVGRGLECRLILLALLAGEHSLLIGPPGTAKSFLVKRLHKLIDIPQNSNSHNLDASETANLRREGYFEVLLTRFSKPEEVLGPLSIYQLQNDIYERITKGYLPSAYIAFLDEIFKANSAILNALLTIINEREFDNGSSRYPVPLLSVIGASNELPPAKGELDALFDRFLVRLWVDNLDHDNFVDLLEVYARPFSDNNISKDSETKPVFSISDLKFLQENIDSVILPNFIRVYFAQLRINLKNLNQKICQKSSKTLKDGNINLQDTSFREAYVSERRWGKIVKLLKTSAFLNKRNYISIWDLLLLPECIASTKEHIDEFNDKLLVDWTEVISKTELIIPPHWPTEEELEKSNRSELIEVRYCYQLLAGNLYLLRDLSTSLELGFNEKDNASLNIWLTSNEFKNRLKEWGRYCVDPSFSVIQSKLATLEEQLKSLKQLLEFLNDIIEGKNKKNKKTFDIGEKVICSVGNEEIIFVKIKNGNNNRRIYISEIPVTLKIVNDIQGIIPVENSNKIIIMNIPEIQTFFTEINNLPIRINDQQYNIFFRLPTQKEYKICILGNLEIDNIEKLIHALNQNRSKIYHRESSAQPTDKKYLQQVERGRRTVDFCPYLKSVVGYQPQLCTISNQQNQYISIGGSKNSSLEEISKSIFQGKAIEDINESKKYSFRLLLEIND